MNEDYKCPRQVRAGNASGRRIAACLGVAIALFLPATMVASAPIPGSPDAPRSGAARNPSRDIIYAIQLATYDDPPGPAAIPADILQRYRLYVQQATKDGAVWYRLRLGFFADLAEAQNVQQQIRDRFPGSWVTKVQPEERAAASASMLRTEGAFVAAASGSAPLPATPPIPVPVAVPAPIPEGDTEASDPIAALMEEGRQAVANGDYPRAIRIYTKVLATPEHVASQDALEFLGLARERNGQEAHAKAEYENYLRLYPDGPGSERVKQRLAGLITAREAPREKLPDQKPAQTEMKWTGNGSLSQYYRRDVTHIDTADVTNVNQSALISDLDLAARGRNADYDVRARFNGGYTYDFLSGGENLSRLTTLYVDASSRTRGISGRLGRQTRGSGGVFQRFDGLLLGYQSRSLGRFNLVGGYPVERTTTTSINNDKVFYGFSTDLPTWRENWNFGAYYITQEADGVTDREAVGGEARYFDNVYSLLALMDYDIHFGRLNIASILGNWMYDDRTTYNVTVNQSRSPFLSTSNALMGQTVTRLKELLTLYTEDEIKDLALDRTATSRALSAGVTRTLHEKLQFNADITLANLSGTPESGGIAATESTGTEYVYSAQLIGNGLLKEGDLGIAGLMYSDASTTDTMTLVIDSRFPYAPAVRINPRLRVDYREYKLDHTTQWTALPSLRLDYRRSQRLDFEIDIGGEWSTRELATSGTEETSGYFLYMGYNLGF